MTDLVVLGLGYSAHEVVATRPQGTRVTGTVRSPERAAAMTTPEVTVLPFDGRSLDPRLEAALRSADVLLVSVPPGLDGGGTSGTGDPMLAAAGPLLATLPLKAIAYLSTVGVYGDHGGGWVDETTEPKPASPRSIARLAAERAWQGLGHAAGVPVAILRLAGIYGPGQNAIENLLAGTARRIIKPGQVFNRIHVADIAQAVWAAFDRRFDGVVNVTDDEPGPPQDVVAFAADLLGMPVPPDLPFETASLSPMARSFYAENKRVSNARLRHELSVNLKHPHYRSALLALAAEREALRR